MKRSRKVKRVSAAERNRIERAMIEGVLASEISQVIRMCAQRVQYLNQFADDTNKRRCLVLEKIQLHLINAKVKL